MIESLTCGEKKNYVIFNFLKLKSFSKTNNDIIFLSEVYPTLTMLKKLLTSLRKLQTCYNSNDTGKIYYHNWHSVGMFLVCTKIIFYFFREVLRRYVKDGAFKYMLYRQPRCKHFQFGLSYVLCFFLFIGLLVFTFPEQYVHGENKLRYIQ